jgi:hypothetical protein
MDSNQLIRPGHILLGLLFVLSAGGAMAHGISDDHAHEMLHAGPLQYIRFGAIHMLTGYDHLLFLFGVMFFLTRVGDIIKFITAFTIGHSITLVFATLAGIQANYYLVDAVIALTVCYKAFENLDGFNRVLQTRAPSLLFMVFAFGLIHGFGLSTRLQQLPLADHGTTSMVVKILSFNVGVELGQIAALIVIMVLLAGWRRTELFRRFSIAANLALFAAGVLLFLMQLHGYEHSHDHEDHHDHAQETAPHSHDHK